MLAIEASRSRPSKRGHAAALASAWAGQQVRWQGKVKDVMREQSKTWEQSGNTFSVMRAACWACAFEWHDEGYVS
eukprot:1159491-Pelagomonas_calceolata.AAC.12